VKAQTAACFPPDCLEQETISPRAAQPGRLLLSGHVWCFDCRATIADRSSAHHMIRGTCAWKCWQGQQLLCAHNHRHTMLLPNPSTQTTPLQPPTLAAAEDGTSPPPKSTHCFQAQPPGFAYWCKLSQLHTTAGHYSTVHLLELHQSIVLSAGQARRAMQPSRGLGYVRVRAGHARAAP
jgi:hypothetical protein